MVDAWSATPPSAQEFPHTPTNGFDALLDRIVNLERRISAIPNNLLSSAGLSVSPDGLTVDSELLVTGSTRIEGTLDLPAGIIGNDALTSPVEAGSGSFAEVAFGVSPTKVARATGTIAVPDGFTQALLFMLVTAGAFNDTATPDYLITEALVNGAGSRDLAHLALGGQWAAGTTGRARILTGLGSTISIGVNVWTATETWSASASSRAACEALVVFLR